jgi:N-acetylglucosamine-6-phosphate deacetylase
MKSNYFLKSGQIITPFETILNSMLGISADGIIESINRNQPKFESSTQKVELKGKTIIPGLIDIHVHGGFGVTFGVGELKSNLEKYNHWPQYGCYHTDHQRLCRNF